MPKELDPLTYGLTIWDLEREFLTGGVAGKDKMALGDLLGVLRDAYCRTIGIEYMHIQDTEEQRWIQSKVEAAQAPFDKDAKHRILERLNAAEAFEKFLATKYVGTKRFGLEGSESAIPILDEVISPAADAGLDSAVIGMAHRGRLNVLSNIIGKSYDAIFREFEGHLDPSSVQGSGDVKYHLGASGKYVAPSGADIMLELAANPSHLETVGPIVEGMVRARQDQVDPPGLVPRAADPDPRRRRLRRPGRGRRDAGDERHHRLPRRRHHPPDHQQPDRVHDGARVRPLVAVLQRRRQDRAGADLPRQRRRPRGVRPGGQAGVRVPPAVPQGRRHRHVVLPAPRAQRGRRPELHAAADVQGDRPAPQRPQAVRRGARQARRHHARRGRAGARRLPGQAAGRPRRDPRRSHRRRSRRPSRPSPSACCRTSRPASTGRDARPDLPPPHRRIPSRSRSTPSWAASSTPAPSCTSEGEVEWATAEALAFGSLLLEAHSVRLAGEDSRRGTFSQRHAALDRLRDRQAVDPAHRPRRRRGHVLGLRLAAVGVRRARVRVRLRPQQPGGAGAVGGAVRRLHQRRPDHHRPVPRRRRGQVGPAQRPRAAAAPRLRGPGPGAQLGPHRALPHRRPPRTTSRSATPRRRPSTSTCCGARCTPSGTRR